MKDLDETMGIDEILGQLAGAASLCWQPKPAGVFDSTQASKFVEEAKLLLEQHIAATVVKELESLHADWSTNQTHGDGNKSFTMLIGQRIAKWRGKQ